MTPEPSGQEVMHAMKLLGITTIQRCSNCQQMWVNLNDTHCRKCGAMLAYEVTEETP